MSASVAQPFNKQLWNSSRLGIAGGYIISPLFRSSVKTAFSSRKLVKRQPFCSLFCCSMLFLIQSADLCAPRQIRTATVTPLKRVPLPVGLPGQSVVVCCAPSEIRTHTFRSLKPVPLPIGLSGQKF